jgi:hypothetical protein
MLERRNSRLRNLLIVLRRVEAYTDRANHLASTTIGRPPSISMRSMRMGQPPSSARCCRLASASAAATILRAAAKVSTFFSMNCAADTIHRCT